MQQNQQQHRQQQQQQQKARDEERLAQLEKVMSASLAHELEKKKRTR